MTDQVQARAREIVAVTGPAVVGSDPGAAHSFNAAVVQFQNAVTKQTGFVAAALNKLDEARVRSPCQPVGSPPATK